MERKVRLTRKTPLKRTGVKRKVKAVVLDTSTLLTAITIVKATGPASDYYRDHIANANGYCENCKSYIPMREAWQQYAAQCHILDKNKFPEVEAEPANHFEGCLPCHNVFDDHYDRIILKKFEHFLPVLRERLQSFIHKVSPENLHKIPAYLI